MFGGKASSTPTRAQRAQKLRQQRASRGTPSKQRVVGTPRKTTASGNAADDEVMVVSGVNTILVALFLVAIGAGIAVIWFAVFSPDCVHGLFSLGSAPELGTNSQADTASATRLRRV